MVLTCIPEGKGGSISFGTPGGMGGGGGAKNMPSVGG